MEISYQISREELINFHIAHFRETKIYRKAMTKQFILVTLIIILTTILFQKLYLFALLILLCGVLSLSRKKRLSFLLRKKLNKVFLSEKYNDYFEKTKIIITETELQSKTNLSEKNYKWQTIKIISLLDNYIFIITTSNDEFLIPNSAFKDNNDKEKFLNALTKNTNLTISYKYPIDTKYK
ncbi:YcxB family protein [Clostridium felsineum]|uniref:YcxB family protein n=1 Tax=Clostridium felsineum TaxID=36839 RepID=UPI00214D735B|nr:YcxB family protein [Clostridium felsineum]MCR3759753.1 YcxB family protein [Clostridium felsineum]